VGLKQLTHEKFAIEQSQHGLEHDHAAAEKDYNAYQACMSGRHR